MLAIVLVLNSLIGLSCLVVAWRLWQLKGQLARLADTILFVEQRVYEVLNPAPDFLYRGQAGTHNLRQRLQQLAPQIQKMQQVLRLLNTGRFLWSQRTLVRRSRRTRKRL